MNISPAVLIIVLAVTSCTEGPDVTPGGKDEPLVQASARMLVLNQEARIQGWDSTTVRQKRDSLLAAFGYTEKDIQQAVGHFGNDNEKWKRFYADVVKELEMMQKQSTENEKNSR